jgi:NADPH:quinone reductase-like Zn-dependent oxidoreductase
MRAVAVRAFRKGPELMELPRPVPGPGEVLVQMAAAGVNPFDWKVIDGIFEGRRPHRFPLIVGIDGAGRVAELGSGVSRFRVGDRIFGQFLHDPVGIGTFAEFATVPESIGVSRCPVELGPVSAAALPTAGMTAVDALERLQLSPGSTLLVVGASGGVGSIATPLAAAHGIHVTAVARSGSASRLAALGATHVIEYNSERLVDRVRALHPSGVDAVLDLVSDREQFARVGTLVRPGGRAATTTFVAEPDRTRTRGVESFNIDLHPSHALLDRLVEEVVARRLSAPVERTVSLAEAPTAIAESRTGRARGKTVVVISDLPSS